MDFLLVLTELFSLGVMAEALPAKIDRKMNNVNLHPISYCLQVIADYNTCQILLSTGRCLSLMHSFGVNP